MIVGLHHVGRTVATLTRPAEQLAGLTGWPIEISDGATDPLVAGRQVARTARAAGPNGWIELVEVGGPAARRREIHRSGVTHAAIQLPQIDAAVERADAVGIERHPGPVDLGTGYRYLYVRDIEQLVIEIEGAPHAPIELDPWLSHGAISTPDLTRLRAAYEVLLTTEARASTRIRGVEAFDRGAMLDDVDVSVTWVPVVNGSVEMWQFHHPTTTPEAPVAYETPGAGHLAFETDDLDGALDRSIAAGFAVVDEPVAGDGVAVARLRDPDANWVELVTFDDEDDPRSLRRRPDLERPARMDELFRSGR